jgi:hypothetical protein
MVSSTRVVSIVIPKGRLEWLLHLESVLGDVSADRILPANHAERTTGKRIFSAIHDVARD